MKAAHKSLLKQLESVRLKPCEIYPKIEGVTINFAWLKEKFGVSIVKNDSIGTSAISDEWTIYQITENQAKNGDARQVIEAMLKSYG